MRILLLLLVESVYARVISICDIFRILAFRKNIFSKGAGMELIERIKPTMYITKVKLRFEIKIKS